MSEISLLMGATTLIIINSSNNVSISNTWNAATLQQAGVGVSTLISNAVASYLPLSGGTITSALTVGGILIVVKDNWI